MWDELGGQWPGSCLHNRASKLASTGIAIIMIMIDSTIVQIAIVMLHISDIDDDGGDNDDD